MSDVIGNDDANDEPATSPTLPLEHASTVDARLPDEVLEALRTTVPAVGDAGSDASVASVPRSLRPAAPASLTAEHAGRYRHGKELGRGGVGRVILAIDDHLGREVAMKELHGSADGVQVGALLRFVREARVTGQLEHPNIVPVHELAQRRDGTFYYTMKRIKGRSLARALRDAPSIAERLKLLGHFRDVCEAIAYAHSRGVVHRDLKPDNVMVGEFGETLVVDWGLAKVRGSADQPADELRQQLDAVRLGDAAQTVAGHAIGTPAYMSPEQARGDLDAIDERSDVWGLGAMLFEILTGRPPFVGTSVLAVLTAVLTEAPPRVSQLAPDAPPELAAIADRALSRAPDARYRGAKEIASEIAAWQDGGRVRAYEYSALEIVRRFVRRNRAASIAAASIGVSIIVAAMFMTWSYRGELIARRAAETRALVAEAGRLDQLGHRPYAFALLRAAYALGGEAIAPDLARAGFFTHADEPQPIVLAGHDALVQDASFSIDGRRVLTCSNDRTIREWDPRTGALLRTIRHDRGIHAIVISADGTRWLTTSDSDRPERDAATVWDATRGRAARDLGRGRFAEAIAITRDGRRGATGGRDGEVRIWDLETGRGTVVARQAGWIRALVFSPDGTRLAFGGREGRVQILVDGRVEQELAEVDSEVRGLDWSSDGRSLAVALQNGTLALYRASDGARERTVRAHGAPTVRVRFSPDGTRIATVSEDATARIWSAGSGALMFDLPHRGRLNAVAFDTEGLRVVTAELDHHTAVVWNVPTTAGIIMRGHDEWVHDASFSPDGTRVASASRDGTVRIWSADSGLEQLVLRGHQGSVYSVRFSPDGSMVASGARDGSVRLWDLETGSLARELRIHTDSVYDLAFLGSDRVASVSVDGSIRVSSTRDGSESWSHQGAVPLNTIAVAGDALAVGDSSGAIEIWHLQDGQRIRRLEGHSQPVFSVDYSSDGSLLVSGSIDGTAILWESSTGRRVREVARLDRGITAVDFSPDNARIVTACEDSAVRVWDAHTGRLVTTMTGHALNVRAAAFSPTGDRIVSGAADETVRVWQSRPANVRDVVSDTADLMNLRACRGSFAVVPVVLGPGVDAVWASDAECAGAP